MEKPFDAQEPQRHDPFPDLTAAGDPALRLVAWLMQNGDARQLEQRTGIRVAAPPAQPKPKSWWQKLFGSKDDPAPKVLPYTLPVLLQLDRTRLRQLSAQSVELMRKKYGVPAAYADEFLRNDHLDQVTARLPLDSTRSLVTSLIENVSELRSLGVSRISLGAPGQPSLASDREDALVDLGLHGRRYNSTDLTGDGVIIGIIDDGCALAHCDFLKPRVAGTAAASRILYLWDQAGVGNPAAGWTAPAGFDGLELTQANIDAALNLPQHKNGDLIREDRVYEYLGYDIGNVDTHGTHVMGIAAGTGQALMAEKGVAPEADIIFVQLPRPAIEGGATVLWRHILDGAAYIFDRASAAGKSAVVNISYGGYDGPHDGTSELEKGLDGLLAVPDRAVVLAAGNGFESRCHALRIMQRNDMASLRWIVKPEDPTANDVEIWYDSRVTLSVRLRSPGPAIDPAGWIGNNQSRTPITTDNQARTIGFIEHLPSTTGNSANRIVISLNATDAGGNSGANSSSPSGIWTVEVRHEGGPRTEVHAWVWRDDSGRGAASRRRQSRFHPDDAEPASTISGWATGQQTVSVGAYNLATGQLCRYSACGPTRPMGNAPGRPKPEVYGPAEEEVRGRGVLSDSARSAMPRRMNGTSASAPYISGLIALIFEYARKYAKNAPQQLTSDEIARQLRDKKNNARLKFDRHQEVDARVRRKQKDVQNELSWGRAHFDDSMKGLPL